MPVCGYVAVPKCGQRADLVGQLEILEGCEVVPSVNSDLLLLATSTVDLEEDLALRRRIESLPGLDVLLLTFGEIDPDTPLGDPLGVARRGTPPHPADSPSAEQPPHLFKKILPEERR